MRMLIFSNNMIISSFLTIILKPTEKPTYLVYNRDLHPIKERCKNINTQARRIGGQTTIYIIYPEGPYLRVRMSKPKAYTQNPCNNFTVLSLI